jgi:hypothetical protein
MTLAILFYIGVGAVIFYAIWGPKNQKPGNTTTPAAPRPSQNPTPNPQNKGANVLVVGGVVGLLFVLGLAWLGGNYGSGNSLFSNSGGSNYRQASGYQPASTVDAVWVNAYYRADGTYVSGHYRSRADGDPSNNWSTSPNVNPYTGKPGSHSDAKN